MIASAGCIITFQIGFSQVICHNTFKNCSDIGPLLLKLDHFMNVADIMSHS
jgi:hypothetical protein